MDYSQLRVEVDDAIGTITLARPDVRNAMSVEMGAELCRAVGELNGVVGLRVVLLRGEGKAFAAGGDFGFLEDRLADQPEHNRRVMRDYYELFLSIQKLHVPTIAVLHGAAIGAGLCLALACDIRLAAPKAKLGVNFVRVGLHPGMGATWLLPRIVGPAKAKELLYTGRILSAEEGLPFGLVNAVHPPEELEAAARTLAEEIAASAPLAVARTRDNLAWTDVRTLDQALDAEASAQALDYATEDMREGLAAAKERRTPKFGGR